MDKSLASLSQIRFRGVPLELLLTLPFIVIALYLVFRWRGFGEDAFTWNHEYFKRACYIGAGICVATYITLLLPQESHAGLLWLGVFVGAVLALSYWGSEDLKGASILSLLIVLIGVLSMPLPRLIRHFLFGAPAPSPKKTLAALPRRSFAVRLPDGWREIPGQSPRTYRPSTGGSGFLHLSMQPPLNPEVSTGEQAAAALERLLASMSDMDFGERLMLSHEPCALGIVAFARYRSAKHGLMQFWMIPTEVTVFASYTDSKTEAAEREIAEAHKALKQAKFE